jgi:hypothetical protein
MPSYSRRLLAPICVAAAALCHLTATAPAPAATWFSTLPAAKQADILWKEDHEGSKLSWDGTGEPWASGDYEYGVVTSPTHSGSKAIYSTIDTSAGSSGVRWAQRKIASGAILPTEAYYSSWVYFPEVFDSDWYMLMQWKTETAHCCSNPMYSVNLDRDGNKLRAHLHSFVDANGEFAPSGSYADVSPITFPTGQWVHLEAYYRWDKSLTGGAVTVWQDGVEILGITGRRTQTDVDYGTVPRQWAVNAYGENISPNPHTMYIDDAAISRSRLSAALTAPIAGDFNRDGHVDAADYTVWRSGLGSTYTQADYNTWRSNFGRTAGAAGATASAVPEPASIVSLIAAITLILPLFCRNRRRGSQQ